jgi:hypothetical protein
MDETTKVDTIWFVSWPTGNLLAFVFKLEETPWEAEYRFRYYEEDKNNDPFNDNDKKNFYKITTSFDRPDKEHQERLVRAMNLLTEIVARDFGGRIEVIPVKGNGTEALRLLEMQPWVHMKVVTSPTLNEV